MDILYFFEMSFFVLFFSFLIFRVFHECVVSLTDYGGVGKKRLKSTAGFPNEKLEIIVTIYLTVRRFEMLEDS
jgi:hypothetical protein